MFGKIVDKDSGILNLQNETSKPMAADHSNICKFERKDDPGYKDIRNLLVNLTAQYTTQGKYQPQVWTAMCLMVQYQFRARSTPAISVS